jgi:hypothetical protein
MGRMHGPRPGGQPLRQTTSTAGSNGLGARGGVAVGIPCSGHHQQPATFPRGTGGGGERQGTGLEKPAAAAPSRTAPSRKLAQSRITRGGEGPPAPRGMAPHLCTPASLGVQRPPPRVRQPDSIGANITSHTLQRREATSRRGDRMKRGVLEGFPRARSRVLSVLIAAAAAAASADYSFGSSLRAASASASSARCSRKTSSLDRTSTRRGPSPVNRASTTLS